jgi:hypothetical protein
MSNTLWKHNQDFIIVVQYKAVYAHLDNTVLPNTRFKTGIIFVFLGEGCSDM